MWELGSTYPWIPPPQYSMRDANTELCIFGAGCKVSFWCSGVFYFLLLIVDQLESMRKCSNMIKSVKEIVLVWKGVLRSCQKTQIRNLTRKGEITGPFHDQDVFWPFCNLGRGENNIITGFFEVGEVTFVDTPRGKWGFGKGCFAAVQHLCNTAAAFCWNHYMYFLFSKMQLLKNKRVVLKQQINLAWWVVFELREKVLDSWYFGCLCFVILGLLLSYSCWFSLRACLQGPFFILCVLLIVLLVYRYLTQPFPSIPFLVLFCCLRVGLEQKSSSRCDVRALGMSSVSAVAFSTVCCYFVLFLSRLHLWLSCLVSL